MININNAKYELTAVKPEQYPLRNLPEVAFVGRSNVGKSSIINTLLARKNLARVASTPGKTREINFYNIDNQLYFVDLPGYGYAKVSKTQKSSWTGMIETYLVLRNQLILLIMMLDIRRQPTDDDQLMYEWLVDHRLSYLLIASKADKIPKSQINDRVQDIQSNLGIKEEEKPIPFSAVTGQGRDEIWRRIYQRTSRRC